MLLHEYKVTKVGRSFCNPEWVAVTAELSDDISEVIPYLNAVIKNAVYTPQAQNLNFKVEAGVVSLMPHEINVGQVASEEDGVKLLDYVKQLINDTWERRTSITPIYERKGEIKAKDVLDYLPKTNCRECGLPTCFAFAMAIAKGQKHLKDCPPLGKLEFGENEDALLKLVQPVGLEE